MEHRRILFPPETNSNSWNGPFRGDMQKHPFGRLWNSVSEENFRKASTKGDATAQELQRILKHCPICQSDFAFHFYTLIATTIIAEDRQKQVAELSQAVHEHRWLAVLKNQEWEGAKDNLEVYALLCTNQQVALMILHSPFELFYNTVLLNCECLSFESSQELKGLIEDQKWKPFNESVESVTPQKDTQKDFS